MKPSSNLLFNIFGRNIHKCTPSRQEGRACGSNIFPVAEDANGISLDGQREKVSHGSRMGGTRVRVTGRCEH